MLAGPLGGFPFVVAASAPFFLNAGTYVASAVLIGLAAGTYRSSPAAHGPASSGRSRSVRADIAEGLRWPAGQRLLRTIALWTIVANSLRQRLTPPDMLGRLASSTLFITAGGNCVGAVLGGLVARTFGLTAPYWIGFVVAIVVSAATWRVFSRAAVARAYAEPAAG
jgi:hypothetical protein